MARLGYDRYGAAGRRLGHERHRRASGQRDPCPPGRHPPDAAAGAAGSGDPRRAHRAGARRARGARARRRRDSATRSEQGTRPQTIGYGLVDSPAALCAWIVEKFHAWTDCDGDLESVLTRDELLDNLMLYWLPGTGASRRPAVLGEHPDVDAWIAVDAGAPHRRARPAARSSRRSSTPVPTLGREALPRHPLLERADRAAATSRPSSSRSCSSTRCAPASASSGGGTRTHNLPVNSRTLLPIELPRIVVHQPRRARVHFIAAGEPLQPRSRRGSWRRGARTCAPPRGCGRASGSAPSGRH